MEDDQSCSNNLETGKSERSVWLMKCPLGVAKSWQSHSPSDPHPVAKVVFSLDPLRPDDPSAREVLLYFTIPIPILKNFQIT